MRNRMRSTVCSHYFRAVVILAAVIFLGACGCSGRTGDGRPAGAPLSITVAEQYGLAYAPLQILQRRGLPDSLTPADSTGGGLNISWVRLENTAAIREAMLSGRVDAGFMGIPPFLIGRDRGMKWRIGLGLSKAPLGLVTWREDIRELADFAEGDKIALPQPGSIQHILLSMACERELGRADALDTQLVTMRHPDGMQALLSRRDIAAHFTSPPYLMEELEVEGTRLLLGGREAMGGEFTFIVGAFTDAFTKSEPEAAEAFIEAVKEASLWTEEHPREAAAILAEEYGMEAEKIYAYLRHDGLIYGPEVEGVEEFIRFMRRYGYLESDFSAGEVMLQ